jgi:uncharacterized membrane protein
MPFLVILAGLSQLVQRRSRGSSAFLPALIAFVMFVIAIAVTLLIEVPIDNQIRVWTPASLPADWTVIRDRWESFHVLRTFSSLGGLILLTGATVFGRPQSVSQSRIDHVQGSSQ